MASLPADIALWLVPLIQALVRRSAEGLVMEAVGTESCTVGAVVPFEPDALAAELAGDASVYGGDLRRGFQALLADPQLEKTFLLASNGRDVVGCSRDGRFLTGEEGRRLARIANAAGFEGMLLRASFKRTWLQRLRPRAGHVTEWAETCLRLPCPLSLNGNWPYGFNGGHQTIEWFGAPPLAEERFSHGSVWGQLADHPHQPGVQLVVHGVVVATETLPELGLPNLAGMVHCPALTVVDGRVQRDALFARLLATLQPVAVALREPRPVPCRVPGLPDPAAHPRFHIRGERTVSPADLERAVATLPDATLALGENGLVVQIGDLVVELAHGALHFPAEALDAATEPSLRALVDALGGTLVDDIGRTV